MQVCSSPAQDAIHSLQRSVLKSLILAEWHWMVDWFIHSLEVFVRAGQQAGTI